MSAPSDRPIETELRLANEAYRSGNLVVAETRILNLVESYPNRSDVQLAHGILLIAKGHPQEGLDPLALAIELDPQNGEALGWAAYTSLNLRQFSAAEQFARSLTEYDPRNARGHYLLASALRGQDRIPEALTAIDRSIEINPQDTDSLVTKARLLKDWQMPGLAVDLYRQALSIRPSAPAAIDLARILLQESHPKEALDILEQVSTALRLEQRPHALTAQALTELHSFDKAEKHWGLAESFAQDRSVVVRGRATAEISVGRFEIAEQLLKREIESGNSIDEAFCILVTARKMTEEDDELITHLVALLNEGSLAGIRLANLHYALGKSLDDRKRYERAMQHFDAANALCLTLYPRRKQFNRIAYSAFIDAQIRIFTKEAVEDLSEDGHPSTFPTFVVGMMRSGTTLTEGILDAHSQVIGVGEQSFWPERAIELFHREDGDVRFDYELAMRFAGEYLKAIEPGSEEIKHVVDKNPANIDLVAMLHCIYPNAKFIHIQRNPVDNLLSLWMTPISGNVGYASDKSNLVFAYREYQRLVVHLQSVIPKSRLLTVQYEDLTSQPRETIASMLEFLNLDPEEACYSPETSARTVLTPSVHQVRQPIHTGAQNRWKNYEPWLGEFSELHK